MSSGGVGNAGLLQLHPFPECALSELVINLSRIAVSSHSHSSLLIPLRGIVQARTATADGGVTGLAAQGSILREILELLKNQLLSHVTQTDIPSAFLKKQSVAKLEFRSFLYASG